MSISDKPEYHLDSSWQEDVIYFLMVDRFHDGGNRNSIVSEGRMTGFGSGENLKRSCGGNLKGVIQKLDYVKGLGCNAIWLSPVLENNPESYHGYAIQNFLKVDPRFGTEEDLINLVNAAHESGLKVYLDAVINHSGDNWSYKGGREPFYDKGKTFEFGYWKYENLPYPPEFRDPDLYHRKGMIRNWDNYPETRLGDFFSLKKFRLDESEEGLKLQDLLVKVYQYWIEKTGCDGFRIDAAKHAGELPVSRFSSRIKEYTKEIGRKKFFLFAEVASSDPYSSSFLKPIISEKEQKVYYGPDSLLDFPLHFLLKKVVAGKSDPEVLRKRFASREIFFQNKHLVNFLDNHDQIESSHKKRIADGLSDFQLLAALGLLFTLPGVPCLYYGTEQGFEGEGDSDCDIREAMFDFRTEDGQDTFNTHSFLYKEIARLSSIRRTFKELIYGEIKWPSVVYGTNRDRGSSPLVFMRDLDTEKTLVVFNTSNNEKCEFFVEIKKGSGEELEEPKVRYASFFTGKELDVKRVEKGFSLKIVLSPEQFIILK